MIYVKWWEQSSAIQKLQNPKRVKPTLLYSTTKKTSRVETLGKIKNSIGQDNETKNAMTIRTWTEGKLIITIDKNETAFRKLQEMIKHISGDSKIRLRGPQNQTVFHIQGMDTTSNKRTSKQPCRKRPEQNYGTSKLAIQDQTQGKHWRSR